jgi:hypothetical protein
MTISIYLGENMHAMNIDALFVASKETTQKLNPERTKHEITSCQQQQVV